MRVWQLTEGWGAPPEDNGIGEGGLAPTSSGSCPVPAAKTAKPKAAGTMLDLPSVKGGNPIAKHGMDQVIDGIEAQKAEDIETLSGFSKAYNG